jgi:hypothetical protein
MDDAGRDTKEQENLIRDLVKQRNRVADQIMMLENKAKAEQILGDEWTPVRSDVTYRESQVAVDRGNKDYPHNEYKAEETGRDRYTVYGRKKQATQDPRTALLDEVAQLAEAGTTEQRKGQFEQKVLQIADMLEQETGTPVAGDKFMRDIESKFEGTRQEAITEARVKLGQAKPAEPKAAPKAKAEWTHNVPMAEMEAMVKRIDADPNAFGEGT